LFTLYSISRRTDKIQSIERVFLFAAEYFRDADGQAGGNLLLPLFRQNFENSFFQIFCSQQAVAAILDATVCVFYSWLPLTGL